MNVVFEKKEYFRVMGIRAEGFRAFPPMFHPHGEVVFVEKGFLDLTVNGEQYRLQEGETALVFPFLPHAYQNAPDSRGIILLFDPAATAYSTRLRTEEPLRLSTDNPRIEPLIRRAYDTVRENKTRLCLDYLNTVLGEILEVIPTKPADTPAADNAVRILTYCSEHYTEPLTLERVASALYLSESYVSKFFSHKLRHGFREYLNALRIRRATELLEDSEKSVLEIMSECGFRNQSSFNRIFRDATSLTPRQWRKQFCKGEK